jgi:hypothetical protein
VLQLLLPFTSVPAEVCHELTFTFTLFRFCPCKLTLAIKCLPQAQIRAVTYCTWFRMVWTQAQADPQSDKGQQQLYGNSFVWWFSGPNRNWNVSNGPCHRLKGSQRLIWCLLDLMRYYICLHFCLLCWQLIRLQAVGICCSMNHVHDTRLPYDSYTVGRYMPFPYYHLYRNKY